MANKKVWSYGMDKTGHYILDNLGRNKTFWIFEAITMKKNDPVQFQGIQFLSTQKDLNKRKRMTPVKSGFFRYIENVIGNNFSGDGLSIAHCMAIGVLSQLKTINFTFGNNIVGMKFTELRMDDLKIQFANGNHYYADLIGIFNEPKHLVEKWGGKVAIEVYVKHECEPMKIKDFKDHNIPIIEIKLTDKMQFQKELNNEQFDANDIEKYYYFLKEKFEKNVYGKVLSDPEMPSYSKLKQIEFKKNIERLEEELNTISLKNANYLERINFFNKQLQNKQSIIDELLRNNKKMTSKTFFEKLADLFKPSTS